MKKIRLGFIGIGQYCRRAYIKQFASNPSVEIIGAYDVDSNAFIKVKEERGIELKSFSTPLLLLDEVDAIVIATPDSHHLRYLSMAASKCKHILVEKPICTSKYDLREVEYILKGQKALVITTAHPRRFDNAYIAARDLVQDGEYGKLLRVELSVVKSKLSNPKSYGNSLLQDHLCHEVDAINFFMGGVQNLNLHKFVDGPERYEVGGITDNGVSLYFSSYANIETQGRHEETITLHFEQSKVFINCSDCSNSMYTDYKVGYRLRFPYPLRDAAKRNQALADNFINAILGKEEIYLSREEVLASAATILVKNSPQIFKMVCDNA